MRNDLQKALTLLINEDREAAVSVLRDAILEAARDIKMKLDEAEELETIETDDSLDDISTDEIEGAEFDGEEVPAEEEEEDFEDFADRLADLETKIAELDAEMDRLAGEEEIDGEVELDADVEGEEGDESELEIEDEFVSESDFTREFELLDADFDGDDDDFSDEIDFDVDLEEGKSFGRKNADDDDVDVKALRKASKEERAGRKPAWASEEGEEELAESIGVKVTIPANKEGRIAGAKDVKVKKDSVVPKQEKVIEVEGEPVKLKAGKVQTAKAPTKSKIKPEIKDVKNAPHVKVVKK